MTETTIPIPKESQQFAKELGVRPEIHPEDFIFHFVEKLWKGDRERAIKNYYELGAKSAKTVIEHVEFASRIMQRQYKKPWAIHTMVDFASGFGGVARHLSSVLPDTRVIACDIHSKAVDFNACILGVEACLSSARPEDLQIPNADLIIALSFFSHMPRDTYIRWLRALAEKLTLRGVLIFTANGYLGDKVILRSNNIAVDEDGFGFRAMSEQKDLASSEYGLTISYPRFVFQALEAIGLRLARFEEAQWWGTQDTYVCFRA